MPQQTYRFHTVSVNIRDLVTYRATKEIKAKYLFSLLDRDAKSVRIRMYNSVCRYFCFLFRKKVNGTLNIYTLIPKVFRKNFILKTAT